jgi:hypothetical protein
MDERVQNIIQKALLRIIDDTASPENIRRSMELHENKIHFVPVQYRVIGGLLQSLNIKFGNFIQELISLVIEADSRVSTLPASGKKLTLSMTAETDAVIDRYITSRQLPGSPDDCNELFQQLITSIVDIEQSSGKPKQGIRKDVDALFEIENGQIIYLEIKYNDDHDTGKFVDINRKFLKTYAGLVNHLNLHNSNTLKPILYYFNPVKRWGPIYVPTTNIYRGAQLFDEFFEIPFADIDAYLQTMNSDETIVAIFDRLYDQIRHNSTN